LGIAIGVTVSVAGVIVSFHADTPSGGTIVLLAIALFVLTLALNFVRHATRFGG
jgi:zinc transport system permease protein